MDPGGPWTSPREVLLKLVHKLTGSFIGWIFNITPLKDHRITVLMFQSVIGFFSDINEVIQQPLNSIYCQKEDKIHVNFNISVL